MARRPIRVSWSTRRRDFRDLKTRLTSAAGYPSKVKPLFTSILKTFFFVSIVTFVVPLLRTVTRKGNYKGHKGHKDESRLAASNLKVGSL